MVGLPLLAGAAMAAGAYTLTPGPAFLALIGIGAGQGRRAAGAFLCGHFAGDVVWSSLALGAIVGSSTIGPAAFELLGLVCGAYLFWIGWKSVRARRRDDGGVDVAVRRPLLRGIAFGLTNPKGYPVAIAMFSAILAGRGAITWAMLPPLLAAASCGFILCDMLLVLIVGTPWSRALFRRHQLAITRISGLVFIGFALETLLESGAGLLHRRAASAAHTSR
jgi:threonine/homoserine/homoserine lactone efflux protein